MSCVGLKVFVYLYYNRGLWLLKSQNIEKINNCHIISPKHISFHISDQNTFKNDYFFLQLLVQFFRVFSPRKYAISFPKLLWDPIYSFCFSHVYETYTDFFHHKSLINQKLHGYGTISTFKIKLTILQNLIIRYFYKNQKIFKLF